MGGGKGDTFIRKKKIEALLNSTSGSDSEVSKPT